MSFRIDEEPLESAGKLAAELFVEIYRGLEERRVAPSLQYPELRDQFEKTISNEGVGLEQALSEFQSQVLPGCMGTANPMYMGLVNSSPLPAGALGDLLVSSLNNNGGTLHQNPSIAALEAEVVRAFSVRLLGHSESTGMLLPGGTFANLQGLMLARSRHFPEWLELGPTGISAVPRLYVSRATHFCVERAASVLGLGRANIVHVPCLERGEMDVSALSTLVQADLREGKRPFAVVGTLGTTGTGAIDPLSELSEFCSEYDLWFHIDGCYGGAALLLPKFESLRKAVSRADSVAVDPHKWFFMPMVCGLLLTRHSELEFQVFSSAARSYIPGPSSMEPYLRGIPTSRRASALALWMCLRSYGWDTVAEAVERNIALTRYLEELAREFDFEVLPGGELSVACLRNSSDALEQERIAQSVQGGGKGWFATVVHNDETWLRCNILNLYVEQKHIQRMMALIAEASKKPTG